MIDYRRIATDLLALGLLAATVFVGLSLTSYDPADPPSTLIHPPRETPANLGGPPGAEVAHALRTGLGLGAWFALFMLGVLDLRLFSRGARIEPLNRSVGMLITAAAMCSAAAVYLPEMIDGPLVGNGGYVGAWGRVLLQEEFTRTGVAVILATSLCAGVFLSGETFLFRWAWRVVSFPFRVLWRSVRMLRDFIRHGRPEPAPESSAATETVPSFEPVETSAADEVAASPLPEPAAAEEPAPPPVEETVDAADDEPEDEPEILPMRTPIRVNPPAGAGRPDDHPAQALNAESRRAVGDFELPGVELLEEPQEFPYEFLAKKAQAAATTLEHTFKQFGLSVRVVEIDTGPVVTQFELELEAGLRLNKVTALADDLAIALRVPAVRVVAPIPGKNTVGVEVPNEKQVMVRLRELIRSCPEAEQKFRIPLFLGKDVSGRPLAVDLAKMPHLLIAGRTGTGKSVCLNTLILSILMTRTPDEVRLLMIDPKMVELSPYKRLPHLMHPVITDMKKAEAVLAWAVDKMEERYDLLARVGVRHLDAYNELGKEAVLKRLDVDPYSDEADDVPESMPYIVIIADEMADMLMTSGKEVEGHIIRLAQKSRAVGIHLVLATQKPTVDVLTGLIKSNLPARISFQVSSRTDSRVVLDEMGAERLLGNGDMLYLAPGTSQLTRAQGTYVSDAETNRLIEFFSPYEPQYSPELAKLAGSRSSGGGSGEERPHDDLYEQAVDVVVREQIGSVSRLQRFLGIGYGRAARMMDWMAEDGIVGDYNGSKAREVLYTPEQWEAVKAGRTQEPVEA